MMIPVKGYRELIINYYDQVEIFSHYLKIDYSDVQYCLETKGYISNPLRVDRNPSLTFQWKKDKIKMIDSARREFNGDVFGLVGLLIGEDSNSKQGFVIICKHIIINVKPYETIPSRYYSLSPRGKKQIPTEYKKSNSIFQHTVRNWSLEDKEYWNSLHVDLEFLKDEYVVPINTILINSMLYYSYTIGNEGYAYNYGFYKENFLIKYYLPHEIKSRKFRTNVTLPFENINDLLPNDNLFIIKSSKDRIVLKSLINKSNNSQLIDLLNRTSLVSFSSEGIKLSKKNISFLKTVYKNIIIYLDNDKVGNHSKSYYEDYNIKVVFLPNVNEKDLSDYAKEHSLKESINLAFTLCQILLEQK